MTLCGRTPVLPGNAVANFHDRAGVVGVVVAASQQRDACRRTQRGRVEAVVLQALAGDRSSVGMGIGPPNALA